MQGRYLDQAQRPGGERVSGDIQRLIDREVLERVEGPDLEYLCRTSLAAAAQPVSVAGIAQTTCVTQGGMLTHRLFTTPPSLNSILIPLRQYRVSHSAHVGRCYIVVLQIRASHRKRACRSNLPCLLQFQASHSAQIGRNLVPIATCVPPASCRYTVSARGVHWEPHT